MNLKITSLVFLLCGMFLNGFPFIFNLDITNTTYTSDHPECYTTFNNETVWKMVFEDSFMNLDDKFNETWSWLNETNECKSPDPKAPKQASCATPTNVHLQHNHLILTTRFHPNYSSSHNFTGATLTTNHHFAYGRYEFRALQPVGRHIRTRIITRNTQESHWPKEGQINIGSVIQDGTVYRDVLSDPIKKNLFNADLNVVDSNPAINLAEFHLYGVEWNESGIQFFFDDLYADFISFNESMNLIPNHQIQLQIGIGGRNSDKLLTNNVDFDELHYSWSCPALIIDYVRVYEKVPNFSNNFIKCQKFVKNFNQEILNDICARALQLSDQPESLFDILCRNWKIILIISLIILFILSITCLLIKIRSMKERIISDANQLSIFTSTCEEDEADHTYEHYEIVNYDEYPEEVPADPLDKVLSADKRWTREYLQLDDHLDEQMNEYVPEAVSNCCGDNHSSDSSIEEYDHLNADGGKFECEKCHENVDNNL